MGRYYTVNRMIDQPIKQPIKEPIHRSTISFSRTGVCLILQLASSASAKLPHPTRQYLVRQLAATLWGRIVPVTSRLIIYRDFQDHLLVLTKSPNLDVGYRVEM